MALCLSMPAPAVPPPSMQTRRRGLLGGIVEKFTAKKMDRTSARLRNSATEPEDHAPLQPPPPHDPLQSLLATQTAAGWFDATTQIDELLKQSNRDPKSLRQAIERLFPSDHPEKSHILSTLLALFLLREHFSDRSALWRRAARKATRAVAQALSKPVEEIESILQNLPTVSP